MVLLGIKELVQRVLVADETLNPKAHTDKSGTEAYGLHGFLARLRVTCVLVGWIACFGPSAVDFLSWPASGCHILACFFAILGLRAGMNDERPRSIFANPDVQKLTTVTRMATSMHTPSWKRDCKSRSLDAGSEPIERLTT